ncbi:5'-3' exonuclease [Spiroplasma turonicum]|uniref:5'-3' exonuclease n=1 Tax=Spiroplasma turonicum TaxID=216946 RepID=A0A0K1P558_9MOLU|nr:5'-3' exonuclease [Spiroplasma turonicum]AKU79299.1 DNA polymerase I [Spiroplasma turonicum]ALX70322.1 DNA polymerase I [Spiroplasma turonicum]
MNRKKVVIIDGYHLLHKGYYGSLKRKKVAVNREGKLINAVYVFVANIYQLIKSKQYHTIIVTFDVGKECWRREIYPEYKATRKDTPPELIPQMQLVRDFLTSANIPWYEKERYEGDDIMGTISRIAVKLGYDVEIFSNDKDTYQLVSDNVTIVSQQSKKADREIVTKDIVNEKFGCLPHQIPDIKSLLGDQSDNIKGVKGLHYKTAIKLITKYGNVESIFENMDDFPIEKQKKLEECKEHVLKNKKITKILNNVEIGRIDFRPLRVNYVRFMGFLKRERMWAFTKMILGDYEEQQKRYLERKQILEDKENLA